jgi:4-hydroxy-3-methylbut-2-en-1-yl diphosphate synthase IspG/GcpE
LLELPQASWADLLPALQAAVEVVEAQGLDNVLLTVRGFQASELLHLNRAVVAWMDAPSGKLGAGSRRYPLLLAIDSDEPADQVMLTASTLFGAMLLDGVGDAVLVESSTPDLDSVGLCYNILQATGVRITKTEFISCPSCGRTLFDLQEVTARIKGQTGHLVGVKIAIMGCIVNGPGEMADADFGYVGGAPGLINLYVGKDCVEKGIPMEKADGCLVELIKSNGKWTEARVLA